MDWSNTAATSGITALVIGVLYGTVKLFQHRKCRVMSGCCEVAVSSGDTPPDPKKEAFDIADKPPLSVESK